MVNSPLSGQDLADFQASSMGLDIVKAVLDRRINVPYMQTLKMRSSDTPTRHKLKMIMPIKDGVRGDTGFVHSGAILSLADAAGGLMARATLPKGKSYLVSSLHAVFRNVVPLEDVYLGAEANVLDGFYKDRDIVTTVDVRSPQSHLGPLATVSLTSIALDIPPASRDKVSNAQTMQTSMPSSPDFSLVPDNPFMQTIGAQFRNDDPAQLRILPTTSLHNSIGTMHGGAIVSALVASADRFVKTTLREGQTTRISSLHVEYLRAVHDSSEPATARASLKKAGSRKSSVDVELFTHDGKESATARVIYNVISL